MRNGKLGLQTGFLLLEVLMSIFVVSVGLVFIISSFITSIKAFKASKSYLEALYLLEEKMWNYEETWKIEEGSDSGTFEENKSAEWDIKAEELEEDLPLCKVTLELTLKEGEKAKKYKIATYFFNEDWHKVE